MTLTKAEIDRARNGSTPMPRPCEACGAPLADHQKRACSSACGRRLGRTRVRNGSKPRRAATGMATPSPAPERPAPPGGLAWLDALPSEVVRLDVELAGGRWVLSRG
jgi:hypothetical protein